MNLTKLRIKFYDELLKKLSTLEKQKEKLEVCKKDFEETLSEESCRLLIKQREAVKIVQAQITFGNRLSNLLETEIYNHETFQNKQKELREKYQPSSILDSHANDYIKKTNVINYTTK